MTKNLKTLLVGLPSFSVHGMENPPVSNISEDSRKVGANGLFVAIKGRTVDGHDYILDATKQGARVIVGELPYSKLELPSSVTYIHIKNSKKALGKIAANWFGNPSKKLRVVGVTGTKGKTTTTHLIYHILTFAGKKAGLVSSLSAKIGEKEEDTGFHVTTPDVISLQRFLAEMVEARCEFAVLEVSSHGIDQGRVEGVDFEIGVLVNIAPEHLDYHKTFAEYKKVKMSFVDSAKSKVIGKEKSDSKFLPGEFNNINADIAVKVAQKLGIDKAKAVEAVKEFVLPQGRLEEIKNDLGLRIVIDFAHTPDSLDAALSYLKSESEGRLIALFGAAGQRDSSKRPGMGAAAAKYADTIILTAEDPRGEDVENINKEISSGIKKGSVEVLSIPDREEAIFQTIKIAQKGDTVAFFGKGHEKSMNLDGSKELPWSEHKVIEKAVKYKKQNG